MDAARLSYPAPDVKMVLDEAKHFQQSMEMPNPPYIRTYLDDPRWGSDKHWEDLARDLLRFFKNAYILPEGLIEPLSLNWPNGTDLQHQEASPAEIKNQH
jgi:hypothetical protein